MRFHNDVSAFIASINIKLVTYSNHYTYKCGTPGVAIITSINMTL